MHSLSRLLITIALLLNFSSSFSADPCKSCSIHIPDCDKQSCCGKMGGISYCDSSAGRYVCGNGFYSSCYCTRHAVMNLQKIEGCCLWQGGVFNTNDWGMVVCNNGNVSETCSLQNPVQDISHW